jgi:hypothetical protein
MPTGKEKTKYIQKAFEGGFFHRRAVPIIFVRPENENAKGKKGLTVSGTVVSTITKISGGTSNVCTSYKIKNIGSTSQDYTWVNCTGGTENNTTTGSGENFKVGAGQSVQLCALSVTPVPSNVVSSLVITTDGTLPCSSAIVDASEIISVGFNGPSISNNCTLLKVLTPQTTQLYNTLYEQYDGSSSQ